MNPAVEQYSDTGEHRSTGLDNHGDGSHVEAGCTLAQAEEMTITWYAFQIDENTYGIFDTFEGEEGRQAHLNGEIATALAKHGPDLLASDPDMRQVAILAVK